MLLWRLVSIALLLAGPVTPVAAAPGATSGDGERLLGPQGAPRFVTGLNYEGPGDRAWQMWNDDKFDAGLIDADFGRAEAAGATALRIFIQAPLIANLASGKWDKLDQVVGLAEKHHLQLIVSLHDYSERDLAKVAGLAGQIAGHYRARPGILAYDLKNEPRFNDLALTQYPSPVPLQQRGLIDAFGERLPRDQLASYRTSDQGTKDIPPNLPDDQAWIYINNLLLYREMLSEAAAWVRDHHFQATTLDYLDDAAGQQWQPLITILNDTLSAWLGPQIDAVRKGDPGRPITVEHVDAVLAKLPANDALDYEALHRYPGTGGAAVRATLNLLGALQRAHAGKPYLLGEFGYATESLDPAKSALHETAIFLGLLAQHAAGGAKWVLDDMPQGFNMRERTLGAFQLDGKPKPIVPALAALRTYLDSTGSPPGDLTLGDDPDTGLTYTYKATDAVLLGGKHPGSNGASLQADGPAQLFVTWTDPGLLRIWASTSLQASLDLGALLGGSPGDVKLARLEGGKEQALPAPTRNGSAITLGLQAGSYLMRLGGPARAADYDIAGGHFFTQANGRADSSAGFSVTNADGIPLWDAYQSLGGADVLGYPVTRRFQFDGFTVQAFQKAVLQWRPDLGNRFAFLNTFDVLHDRGLDDWLQVYRQTPPPLDTAPDTGLSFDKIIARHLALLDKVPGPLKDRFLGDDDWLNHYGLPVASQEYPNSVVVRAQRATFQFWKEAVPWAAKGSVSVANGGDLAKEAGVFPWQAVVPENAPR